MEGFTAEKVKVKYPDLIKRAFQLFSKLNFIRITCFSNSLAANEMNIFLIRKKVMVIIFLKKWGKKKLKHYSKIFHLIKLKENYLQTEGK